MNKKLKELRWWANKILSLSHFEIQFQILDASSLGRKRPRTIIALYEYIERIAIFWNISLKVSFAILPFQDWETMSIVWLYKGSKR